MNVYAINGSPRKNRNTAALLKKALEGAASQGADTELIHLYDLNFKGCTSCFACKEKDGKSFGTCAMKDDVTPVLEKLHEADALFLGSPIYFMTVTGEMKSFLERLCFPYMQYSMERSSLFEKKIPIGFIYTMNVTEERFKQMGYGPHIAVNETFLQRLTGHAEALYAYNTYQFDDYSRYVNDIFDEKAKAQQRQEVFPKDCERAFNMGVRFAQGDVTFQKVNLFDILKKHKSVE